MAVLTQNAVLRFRRPTLEKRDTFSVDTSGAQTIWLGAPVMLDVSVDTLYLRMYTDATTPTISAGNDVFMGIAMAKIVVAAADNELATELEVLVSGEVGFKSAVFTDADMGKVVYMSDNNTLTATASTNLKIGTLVRVQDGFAFVNINTQGGPTLL